MSRIEREKNVVRWMIGFYCTKKHKKGAPLCEQCHKLLKYAHQRLDYCPYGEDKHSCRKCITPCYGLEERDAIKKVMGYSGPRIIYCKPLEGLSYYFRRKRIKN